eukprot:5420432-Amphidinium_carterae.1
MPLQRSGSLACKRHHFRAGPNSVGTECKRHPLTFQSGSGAACHLLRAGPNVQTTPSEWGLNIVGTEWGRKVAGTEKRHFLRLCRKVLERRWECKRTVGPNSVQYWYWAE